MGKVKSQSGGLVSVIVPAYNVENYIQECMDSILDQTYSNLELIVVDDGSTDGTWPLIEKAMAKDSRVIGVRRPNSGVSATRNYGLEQAKGEYIKFVDSDDYIAENALETLVSAMEEHNADCVTFQYFRVDDQENHLEDFDFIEGMIDTNNNDEKLEMIVNPLLNYDIGYEVWIKLYRNSIIKKHNIKFLEDCHIGEDLAFNICYSLYASNIYCVKDRLYYYRIHDDSAMGSLRDPSIVFKERLTLAKGIYPVCQQVFSNDINSNYYKLFFKLMMGASRHYTAEEITAVAKELGGDFYKQWLSEAVSHKAEFNTFYSKDKVNLFYHYGLYINSVLNGDYLSGFYLKFYNMYRILRKRPPINKWRMP